MKPRTHHGEGRWALRMRSASGVLSVCIVVAGSACGGSGRSARAPDQSATNVTAAEAPAARGPTLAELERQATPGALTSRQIENAVGSHATELRNACGAKAIPRIIDRYEGQLHLEIAASGNVDIARARGNQPVVDGCISDVARTWSFPAAHGRTVANVPIVFDRGD